MTNWKSGESTYSAKDLMRMQREAEERVREMQERSRRALQQPPTYPDFARAPSSARQDPRPDTHSQSASNSNANSNSSHHPAPIPPPQPQFPSQSQPHPHPGSSVSAPVPAPSFQTPPVSNPEPSSPPPKAGGLLGNLADLLGGGGSGDGKGPISRVMDALNIDNDRLLLIILLFVLLNNNTDKKLILALCYVML